MENIEFELKLLLHSKYLQIYSVKEFKNEGNNNSFERNYGPLKKLDSFITKVPSSNNVEIPLNHVPINTSTSHHTILYVKAAIGNAMLVEKKYAMNYSLPNHFNSFMIQNKENDENENSTTKYIIRKNHDVEAESHYPTNKSSKKEREDYEYGKVAYVLKDKNQMSLLYELQFEYDKELEAKGKGKCERCQVRPAHMYCLAERAAFCDSCDVHFHHEYFTKRHIMYHYDTPEKQRKLLFCIYHHDQILEFFCEVCLIPLCGLCKLNGVHSCAAYKTHTFIKWSDAVDKYKERIDRLISSYKEKIEEIRANLEIVTKNRNDYKIMINEIKKRINMEYRNALIQLQNVAGKEEQGLEAQVIELRMDIEKKENIIKFIKENRGGNDVKYLSALEKNNKVILITNKNVIRNEIILKGNLSVYVDEHERFNSEIIEKGKGNDLYIESKMEEY